MTRRAEGDSHLMRNSGRYPLCGRGDINTYAVFAEAMRTLFNDKGRVGCIVPTGIATDDTTKFFFQEVVEKKSLVSLLDFENRQGLFPAVDSRMRFCLFTSGAAYNPQPKRPSSFSSPMLSKTCGTPSIGSRLTPRKSLCSTRILVLAQYSARGVTPNCVCQSIEGTRYFFVTRAASRVATNFVLLGCLT